MSYQSDYSGAQVEEAVGKALNPDAAPTDNSTNLVTSGGVASAVSAVQNTVSRRNLLDNPWFRINQRGATSGTGVAYIADRWKTFYGSGGVTYSRTDDTVTIQSTSGSSHGDLVQVLEPTLWADLDGKTVTFSVMLNDYSIRSATFVFSSSSAISESLGTGLDGNALQLSSNVNGKFIYVQKNKTAETFRAFKLELGSVSTLANDAPPCFAEELLKCQRYFVRISGYYTAHQTASAVVPYDASVPFPVQMRAVPTISNITYVGSAQASGYDASYSGMLRFYSTSGGFAVESFNASADL